MITTFFYHQMFFKFQILNKFQILKTTEVEMISEIVTKQNVIVSVVLKTNSVGKQQNSHHPSDVMLTTLKKN